MTRFHLFGTAFTRVIVCLLFVALSLPGALAADEYPTTGHVNSQEFQARAKQDKPLGWSFSFDNDFLVPGKRDQDYTYGFNIRYTGNKTEQHWSSLHAPLNYVDTLLGLNKTHRQNRLSNIEFGLLGFTPEKLNTSQVIEGDRPYASLLYTTSSKERVNTSNGKVINTALTVGIIGAGVVEQLQKSLHKVIDSEQPLGWKNQISDGGELTAKYAISQQQLLSNPLSNHEIKHTAQAIIGYITELSYSVSFRSGRLSSPWRSFNPELASYGEGSSPTKTLRHFTEHYLWAGMSIKARAYNAFLQGQFRQSALTYKKNALNTGILEAWIGYTVALKNGYTLSYSLRGHTSELKSGTGDRSVMWGGLNVTKAL